MMNYKHDDYTESYNYQSKDLFEIAEAKRVLWHHSAAV